MQATQIFDRIKELPDAARQELFDFLQFLEWKYAEETQPMSDREFELFIADRASDSEKEAQLMDGETAIGELRDLLKNGQPLR